METNRRTKVAALLWAAVLAAVLTAACSRTDQPAAGSGQGETPQLNLSADSTWAGVDDYKF